MSPSPFAIFLVATLVGTCAFAADPKNADELIDANPELAPLRSKVDRSELKLDLYAELGDMRMQERYRALLSPGKESEYVDTMHALELLVAQCHAPACNIVRKVADELSNRLVLLHQAEQLAPPLPAPEDELRVKVCTREPCVFALGLLGDTDGAQVHVVRVSTQEGTQVNYDHRYMGRVFVRARQVVRFEILVSSDVKDCSHEPHCVAVDFLYNLNYDPAAKTISSSHQYNRNTWDYKFSIFPEVRPLHADEQHWGFEKYDDPETAYSNELIRDWVSGYTSDLGFPECGAAAATASASGGYLIPLNVIAPRDWRRDIPSHRAMIHVPEPSSRPPEGFVIPMHARIDPAVWFSVAAIDPRILWVEVHDPAMHTQVVQWLQRSHLEVWNWTGPPLARDGTNCLSLPWLKRGATAPDKGVSARVASPPQQWAIDLDGKNVHIGFGSLTGQALGVEAFRLDASTVRLKIVLPQAPAADDPNGRRVAIAYSVSDGRKQVGLLATSALRRADPATFSWIGELGDDWF